MKQPVCFSNFNESLIYIVFQICSNCTCSALYYIMYVKFQGACTLFFATYE